MQSRQARIVLAASLVVALLGCTRPDKKNEADRTVRSDGARPATTPGGRSGVGSADQSRDPDPSKPSPLGPLAPKRNTRGRSSGIADRTLTPPPRD